MTSQDASNHPAKTRTFGMALAVIGLGGFFPALITSVFYEPWQFHAAIAAFVFFWIWKWGKTLLKVQSDNA